MIGLRSDATILLTGTDMRHQALPNAPTVDDLGGTRCRGSLTLVQLVIGPHIAVVGSIVAQPAGSSCVYADQRRSCTWTSLCQLIRSALRQASCLGI